MQCLGMYQFDSLSPSISSQEVRETKWIRAPRSGIFHLEVSLGETIDKKQILGFLTDAFGENSQQVRASCSGIVIGYTQNPLVNQGDGIVHIAFVENSSCLLNDYIESPK
jgi:hypothetical protein